MKSNDDFHPFAKLGSSSLLTRHFSNAGKSSVNPKFNEDDVAILLVKRRRLHFGQAHSQRFLFISRNGKPAKYADRFLVLKRLEMPCEVVDEMRSLRGSKTVAGHRVARHQAPMISF